MCQIISKRINAADMKLEYKLYVKLRLDGNIAYNIQVRNGTETAVLLHVAHSYKLARELFDMLVNGLVTPITAFDILDDWLLR